VSCWTPNDDADLALVLDLGVDAVMTDRIGALTALLDARGPYGSPEGRPVALTLTHPAPAETADVDRLAATRVARRPAGWWFLLPALVVFAAFTFFPLGRSFFLSVQGSDLFGNPSGFVGLAQLRTPCSPTRTSPGSWPSRPASRSRQSCRRSRAASRWPSCCTSASAPVRFFRTAFALPFAFSVATAFGGVLRDVQPGVGRTERAALPCRRGPDRLAHRPGLRAGLSESDVRVDGARVHAPGAVSGARRGCPTTSSKPRAWTAPTGGGCSRSIVIPLLTPQLFFLLVTGTIHALQSFGQIHILTRGGPDSTTTTLVYSIYDQAFANNNSHFGYASAQAIVLLAVVVAITAVQFGVLERKVFYR